jgi:hypothetical protein
MNALAFMLLLEFFEKKLEEDSASVDEPEKHPLPIGDFRFSARERFAKDLFPDQAEKLLRRGRAPNHAPRLCPSSSAIAFSPRSIRRTTSWSSPTTDLRVPPRTLALQRAAHLPPIGESVSASAPAATDNDSEPIIPVIP